jgi:integrase
MEIASFMTELEKQPGIAAHALEFTILTAARTGETIGARFEEIDFQNCIWVVPAARMKSGREHRVPLPGRAVQILEHRRSESDENSDFIFPGRWKQTPLSNMAMLKVLERMSFSDLTVHGFRSTFRDWAAERTSFQREVVEAALAHSIGDKVEAAYRRGDLLEKRRLLMDAWAQFTKVKPKQSATVLQLERRN